ncbi:hypothetical protein E2C01_027244 [Portunus trituberculatus]|uniref:Uncharacterized protein n=1 Tax=Portunus trituberculatus TaxID=210409 RepID=A0A5B7EKT9_PORTR|nr:hypothetical protein [Portunus trituberculatus]
MLETGTSVKHSYGWSECDGCWLRALCLSRRNCEKGIILLLTLLVEDEALQHQKHPLINFMRTQHGCFSHSEEISLSDLLE